MITLIATDGSGIRNKRGGKGFYAAGAYVYETYDGETKIASGGRAKYLGKATSNIGEITALYIALKHFENCKDDETHTFYFLLDSEYVMKSITSWMFGWERMIKTSKDGVARTLRGTPVKHFALIKKVYDLYFSYKKRWIFKVRSHVTEDRKDAAYKEFLKVNETPVTRELWEKCNELNQQVDALVHSCAKAHEDISLEDKPEY